MQDVNTCDKNNQGNLNGRRCDKTQAKTQTLECDWQTLHPGRRKGKDFRIFFKGHIDILRPHLHRQWRVRNALSRKQERIDQPFHVFEAIVHPRGYRALSRVVTGNLREQCFQQGICGDK